MRSTCDADYSANLAVEEIMLEQEFVTSWSASHEEIRGLSFGKAVVPRSAISVCVPRFRSTLRAVLIDCIAKEEQRKV